MFLKVCTLRNNNPSLTPEIKEQILLYKSLMNKGQQDSSKMEPRLMNITWSWLLGFTEGDGSFSISGTTPRFFIDSTKAEVQVLDSIRDFLGVGNVNIRDNHKTRVNQKATVVFSINSIDFMYNFLIPELDQSNFYSKKYLDYIDWKIIVKLNYFGYHLLPEGLELINALKSRMSNKRLSSYSNSQSIINVSEQDIARVLELPAPYEIRDKIRYKTGTNTKVYTKINKQ